MPEYESTASMAPMQHSLLPQWLTKDYVERSLRVNRNDESVRVVNYKVSLASKKGDSYASVMYRIWLNYVSDECPEKQEGNFMAKLTIDDDDFFKEKVSPYDIFKREIEIYEIVIPKMCGLLEKGGIYEDVFPKTISVDYDRDSIIFEDLGAKNYVMASRLKGLDMAHAKLVLRKLAKMHAASAVLNEVEPGTFKTYDRGFFNRHTNVFRNFYEGNLIACANQVAQWDDFQYYAEKLRKLRPMLMELGKKSFELKNNFFNVLNHGDLWVNNVMFKYNEENKPEDAILIDFQYAVWTSPAIDLHYFFHTSLRHDLRMNNQDELVQFYYFHLVDALKALKFKGKIPNLKEFWAQMFDKSFYAFITACLVQPIQLNENTDNADFSAIVGDDQRAREFKSLIFSNEKVHSILRSLLPVFDRRGLLDVH